MVVGRYGLCVSCVASGRGDSRDGRRWFERAPKRDAITMTRQSSFAVKAGAKLFLVILEEAESVWEALRVIDRICFRLEANWGKL